MINEKICVVEQQKDNGCNAKNLLLQVLHFEQLEIFLWAKDQSEQRVSAVLMSVGTANNRDHPHSEEVTN